MASPAVTSIVVFICGLLATGAGVGGGALFIPVLILIGDETNLAIPIAKSITFGCAITMYMMNIRKTILIVPNRPDFGTKPLINYTIALLMEPMTLAGSVFGVRLNDVFPFYLKTLLMVLLGILICRKMFVKGLRLHRSETAAKLAAQQQHDDRLISATSTHSRQPHNAAEGSYSLLNDSEQQQQHLEAVEILLQQEKSMLPIRAILPLIGCWVLLVIETLVVNTLKCGSIEYWCVVLSCVLVLVGITVWNARNGIQYQKQKNLLLGDIARHVSTSFCWDVASVVQTCAVSFLAGVLSACIGIGGSTVKGPYLQLLIDDPEVSAATSAFMLLTTSSASMIQFVLLGDLGWSIAEYWMVIGFFAALFGTTLMAWLIRSLGKRSLIVFALGAYVALGISLMAYVAIKTAIQEVEDGDWQKLFEFQGMCQR